MRKLIAVALLLVAGVAWGKSPPPDPMPVNADGRYEYTGVVDVHGATADELFSRARAWVTKAYRSATHVIDLEDHEARRLVIKGTFQEPFLGTSKRVEHVVMIEARDGRYRYVVGDFMADYVGGGVPLENKKKIRPGGQKLRARVHADVLVMLDLLRETMESESDADW